MSSNVPVPSIESLLETIEFIFNKNCDIKKGSVEVGLNVNHINFKTLMKHFNLKKKDVFSEFRDSAGTSMGKDYIISIPETFLNLINKNNVNCKIKIEKRNYEEDSPHKNMRVTNDIIGCFIDYYKDNNFSNYSHRNFDSAKCKMPYETILKHSER